MRERPQDAQTPVTQAPADDLVQFSGEIATLLEEARRQSARAVNALMTATYWEIGRRIVEFEQKGQRRAQYGEELLERLARDLTARCGRGFGFMNLNRMRTFFLNFPPSKLYATLSQKSSSEPTRIAKILSTPSIESPQVVGVAKILSTPSIESSPAADSPIQAIEHLAILAEAFPLSWSHYVRLLTVKSDAAREFYEAEALRGGWSIRQLDRQISTQFYERTALSRNKAAMLTKGAQARPEDAVSAEEEIKSPYVLEFLDLKDEYSETELEEALIRHLESFLLELGNEFTFVARQKRLHIDHVWYRIDLLFYHRRLRCLVIIDLKVGEFTHADAGQMNLYVNYAAEHLTLPEENPPVGMILCSEGSSAVAHYALGNMQNQILAAQYRLALPDPKDLEAEIAKTRRMLESPSRRQGNIKDGREGSSDTSS